MFKVTESIHHGGYRNVSVAVGRNIDEALTRVLKRSPYNSNMDQDKKQELAFALADGKTAGHGWADYTCEFRANLTDCEVVHSMDGIRQPALVLSDEGDTILVVEYPEGEGPLKGEEQDVMPRERIDVVKVEDFTARPDY